MIHNDKEQIYSISNEKHKITGVDGNILVIANPGTGKTESLATRVIELLKAGVLEKEILCITFTTKAADEMRHRIAQKVKKENLNKVKLNEISIHTFHSYALDYLTDIEKEYQIIGNNAMRYSIYKNFERSRALNYSNEHIISDIVPRTENAIRYLKSFGILPDRVDRKKVLLTLKNIYVEEEISNITLEENEKFFTYFMNAFEDYEAMKPKGYIDYNDMLIQFEQKYDKSKRHYQHVLVDELQDVNELEANIAARSGDNLFLVGDRKQAIFGFQGGSVGNFKKFDRTGTKKETKTLNYRSTQQVLDYAKTHFLNNTKDPTHKEELEGLRSNDEIRKGEVQVIVTDNSENAAIKKALELLKDKEDQSVALMARTNDQLLKISTILDSKGVEYTSTISNLTSNNAKEEIVSFLKGVLYDDQDIIVSALFTPFSGMTLKDAFAVSEKHRSWVGITDSELKKMAEPFYALKERSKNLPEALKLFNEIIAPICVSIGKDYFITASALQRNVEEFFQTVQNPTREDLFNYLAVTEESYEPMGKERKLVLTTVHKAKGLEFDNVVYVPKATRNSFSFVDAVVYSIIKSTLGEDIREELEEEKLRLDFVAFTRSKNSLYIVTNEKVASRYTIEGLSSSKTETAYDEPEPLGQNYNKAYTMFVTGQYDKAKEILSKKDTWLRELIYDYFTRANRLSYSLVEALKDPYEFLKNNIIGIPRLGPALKTGSRVHEMAENVFKGAIKSEQLTEEDKGFLNNILSLNHQIKEKYGAKQVSSEEEIKLPLNETFAMEGNVEMEFKGKIDAVYECGDGKILIVDWKTDKSTDYARDHRRQLAVYKRLYSKKHNIDEMKISVALAFVGLRGKINVGRLDSKLEDTQPTSVLIKNFEKDVQEFLRYKREPEEFIKDILSNKIDEMLYEMVKGELFRA